MVTVANQRNQRRMIGETLVLNCASHHGNSNYTMTPLPGILLGALVIADTIKPEAPVAVHALHRMGLRVVLLTGDNRRTAGAIADEVRSVCVCVCVWVWVCGCGCRCGWVWVCGYWVWVCVCVKEQDLDTPYSGGRFAVHLYVITTISGWYSTRGGVC